MNTRPRSSTAERFGRWLGRGYVRRERRAVAWLASVGVPSGAATALVWIVKLAVLGVLLYAAFWLALRPSNRLRASSRLSRGPVS